jgi:hypothetical protein
MIHAQLDAHVVACVLTEPSLLHLRAHTVLQKDRGNVAAEVTT